MVSAWDITGALIWTPLAALWFFVFCNCVDKDEHAAAFINFITTVGLVAASVFCIARLWGARL